MALQKTDVVLMTKKHILTMFPVHVGDEMVEIKPTVKYLRLMADCKLSFLAQIWRTAIYAAEKVSRLMANVGGLSFSK